MTSSRRGERSGPNPDARMLRRVRLRLIAWSAGSTLVVLLVLGGALYVAVSQSLVSQSTQTLANRIDQMAAKLAVDPVSKPQPSALPRSTASPEPSASPSAATTPPANTVAEVQPVNVTMDASQPGLVLGGTTSGTIAFALDPDSNLPVKLVQPSMAGNPAVYDVPEPDAASLAAARNGRKVVWEGDLHGTPARFLLEAIPTAAGTVLVESINDRTSELVLLRTLLVVLLLGGLVALVAAVVLGYAYAGRALVPIRRSMQRQRDFAADASHELRTPLAIVRGAVEELRTVEAAGAEADADADSRARSLADIEAGATRLGQLVDDLLLLARADSGAVELRRENVDLAEIATDAAAAFARQAAEAGVRLRVDVEPSPLVGDPDRLCQVVGILVDNAIKHSPEGGPVTVTVRPGATLAVEDEGPGIRPEDRPRLFDRFWRAADAPGGGTGLGLAIASWIATSHGGTITAANRTPDGAGARFVVTLPGQPDH